MDPKSQDLAYLKILVGNPRRGEPTETDFELARLQLEIVKEKRTLRRLEYEWETPPESFDQQVLLYAHAKARIRDLIEMYNEVAKRGK